MTEGSFNSMADPLDVAGLVEGGQSAADGRSIVRRLLTRAVRSRRSAVSPGGKSSPGLRGGFPRLAERASLMAREQESLPSLLSRLRGLHSLPTGEQRGLLLSDPAFHSWVLCEQLIEECRDLAHAETMRADALADLVVSLTDRLSPQLYGETLVNDLRARSWTCAGSVLLGMADLHGAEEALARAEALLEAGTGDGLEEAYLLEVSAALLQNREEVAEAHLLIDEAVDIYRQYRDFHLVGRAFIRKGEICLSAQDVQAGIRWLRKGIGLLDPARELRLALAARLSLMLALQESGRHREAWFLLKTTRSEVQESGGELLSLRLVWLEGEIQQALGHPVEAERSLIEARHGFIAQGAGFDAAAATLDLALLYASQGRSSEMRRLGEEMLAIASARDLHREALAAVIVFQQAAWMDRVSSDLLLDIRAYLHRARKDSKLRFEVTS